MNENDQRIAIAEACGTLKEGWWCPVCKVAVEPINVTHDERHDERCGFGCGNHVVAYQSPDYLHDLNAMHETEKALSPQQQTIYRNHLASITTVERYPKDLSEAQGYSAENEWAYCHATAAQRAEAFLRTIGKWTDDPAAP